MERDAYQALLYSITKRAASKAIIAENSGRQRQYVRPGRISSAQEFPEDMARESKVTRVP
jgi:hypothetical protein